MGVEGGYSIQKTLTISISVLYVWDQYNKTDFALLELP